MVPLSNLYCYTLHCVLHYTELYCPALHCTARCTLHHTLHCTALHCTPHITMQCSSPGIEFPQWQVWEEPCCGCRDESSSWQHCGYWGNQQRKNNLILERNEYIIKRVFMVFVVVSEWLAAPDYEEHKHGHCEEGEGCSWQDAQEGGEVKGDRLGLHLGRGASTGEEYQNYLHQLKLANCFIYLSIVCNINFTDKKWTG